MTNAVVAYRPSVHAEKIREWSADRAKSVFIKGYLIVTSSLMLSQVYEFSLEGCVPRLTILTCGIAAAVLCCMYYQVYQRISESIAADPSKYMIRSRVLKGERFDRCYDKNKVITTLWQGASPYRWISSQIVKDVQNGFFSIKD